MFNSVGDTLMTRFLLATSAALALAACGGVTDTAEDIDNAVDSAAAEADEFLSSDETVTRTVETAAGDEVCVSFGPQTPRDITSARGTNVDNFQMAPAADQLNLCNIHTHTQAEHRGPGFSVRSADGQGYQCNGTADLTAAELADYDGERHFEGAEPGDTIEVHWVHSSCDVAPGEGLGSCLTESCTDPLLRVETQVFLVVNDRNALQMTDLDYIPGSGDGAGFHQAPDLPSNTGTPVVFRGSTTGPSYDQQTCSPVKVTWSVRPQCAKIDVASVHAWAEDNVFNETKTHGVRELVTDERLLSPIR